MIEAGTVVRNRWDERYLSGEMADKAPEPRLADAAAAAICGEALDLACGSGRHTLWLARRGWHVTAVDYSGIAIQSLAEKAQDLAVRIVRADLEREEFAIEPGRYNLIVDTCFLHRPLFPAIRAGAKPGGVFFGVFPMEGLNPSYLMAPDELRNYFEGWEILHYFEGWPAPGRRRRAELIARKPEPAPE